MCSHSSANRPTQGEKGCIAGSVFHEEHESLKGAGKESAELDADRLTPKKPGQAGRNGQQRI